MQLPLLQSIKFNATNELDIAKHAAKEGHCQLKYGRKSSKPASQGSSGSSSVIAWSFVKNAKARGTSGDGFLFVSTWQQLIR